MTPLQPLENVGIRARSALYAGCGHVLQVHCRRARLRSPGRTGTR